MNARRALKRGFTLVELMIVVAIIGVLAALAIYGVRKYIANAKTAEARNSLGQMATDAQSAFNREGMKGQVLGLTSSTAVINRLCGSATATVPASKGSIQGRKYQSSPAEWNAGSTLVGWQCLHFSMDDPQYYMYDYQSSGTNGHVNDTYQALAYGDLNGDGNLSTFELDGKIQAGASGGMVVTRAPNIQSWNPEE